MPRMNYATQQAKLEREISKLQKQAQALQTKQRKPILMRIVKDMQAHDITIEELQAALPKKRVRKVAVKSVGRKVSPSVAPKYRHPETGETWTGRGKSPRWLAAAEAAGTSREQFLIAQ